ncbi:hypothetical protein Efla_004736 [Eimeria flavescens]
MSETRVLQLVASAAIPTGRQRDSHLEDHEILPPVSPQKLREAYGDTSNEELDDGPTEEDKNSIDANQNGAGTKSDGVGPDAGGDGTGGGDGNGVTDNGQLKKPGNPTEVVYGEVWVFVCAS